MRPLTKEETKVFFEKLSKYIGRNVKELINPEYCFRIHLQKIYYLPVQMMNITTAVERKKLISFGTMFGKLTKTMKCRLSITCLDYLSKYAIYKVWLKPSGEMGYMYGNHVLKAHIGRMTEDIPEHTGVVISTMSDIPIGFGVTAKNTNDVRKQDPTAISVYHQSDVGEYVRVEDDLF
jgi:60S ribosome subunit biogenesis protein NIP7